MAKKWLAVDTSTKALTIALAEELDENNALQEDMEPNTELGGGWTGQPTFTVTASHTSSGKNQHGETLVPAVAQLMETVGWKPDMIDGIVIGIGPGSYTGLRMGVTFAKVWATNLKVPLYTISSLALLLPTLPVKAPMDGGLVLTLPVMDARRGTVYTGAYLSNPGSQLKTIRRDQHILWTDFLTDLAPIIEQEGIEQVQLIGQNLTEFSKKAKETLPDTQWTSLEGWEAYPHADRAFSASHQNLLTAVADPAVLAPNYAHATLAEQEWAEKNNRHVANSKENEAYIEHFSE